MLAFFLAMMGPFTLHVGLEIEIMFVHIDDNTKLQQIRKYYILKGTYCLKLLEKKINVNLWLQQDEIQSVKVQRVRAGRGREHAWGLFAA